VCATSGASPPEGGILVWNPHLIRLARGARGLTAMATASAEPLAASPNRNPPSRYDPSQTGYGAPRRRPRRTCPLCGERALIINWRPSVDWAGVEDCRCDSFFVWTVLLDSGRLDVIPPEECARLQSRILELRAREREAWLHTADGTPRGALLVRTERPEWVARNDSIQGAMRRTTGLLGGLTPLPPSWRSG
jgi:hypothetical protein